MGLNRCYWSVMSKDDWGMNGSAIDGGKRPSEASKEGSGTGKEWAEKRDKMKRQVVHPSNEHPQ